MEPGARCRVCPPPRRARMMDGCSQLARPPGRPRYLHNTGVPPVTSDTALPGAEARWPPRFLQPPEDWDSLKAQPGQGKEGQQPALGSESGASSLPASHGGRRRPGGGVAASQERQDWTSRAFKSVWFPSRSYKQSLQGREAAARGGDSTMESWAWSCQAADTLA